MSYKPLEIITAFLLCFLSFQLKLILEDKLHALESRHYLTHLFILQNDKYSSGVTVFLTDFLRI